MNKPKKPAAWFALVWFGPGYRGRKVFRTRREAESRINRCWSDSSTGGRFHCDAVALTSFRIVECRTRREAMAANIGD